VLHPAIPRVKRSLVRMMQELADVWIDSGKSGADRSVDAPYDRNTKDAPPGHTWAICDLYDLILRKDPKTTEMGRDGKQIQVRPIPRIDMRTLSAENASGMLNVLGERLAVYFFAELLHSPYARHLARCDRCGRYFAYERVRKGFSEGGVYCREHAGSGSLVRCQFSRERMNRRRIQVAADAWASWDPAQVNRAGDRAAWVVRAINSAFPNDPKKQNWVNRNRAAIEKEVEERKHAKG
jgi:hypothetical protein